jgi:hypothetical protein
MRVIDAATCEAQARYLEKFLRRANYADVAVRLDIKGRLERVVTRARVAKEPSYADTFTGTLGGEPAVARDIARAHRV